MMKCVCDHCLKETDQQQDRVVLQNRKVKMQMETFENDLCTTCEQAVYDKAKRMDEYIDYCKATFRQFYLNPQPGAEAMMWQMFAEIALEVRKKTPFFPWELEVKQIGEAPEVKP